MCELVQKCTKCHRTVGDLKKHVCGHATTVTVNLIVIRKRISVTCYPLKPKAVRVRAKHRAADLKKTGVCVANHGQPSIYFTIWRRSRIRGRSCELRQRTRLRPERIYVRYDR